MGVDFYTCTCCGEVFDDCGYYEYCAGCDSMFCPGCASEIKFEKDEDDDENIRCNICRDGELRKKKEQVDKLEKEIYEELKKQFKESAK